jgi:hypothetical protein
MGGHDRGHQWNLEARRGIVLLKNDDALPLASDKPAEVGCRWYAKTGAKPLYAFGHASATRPGGKGSTVDN